MDRSERRALILLLLGALLLRFAALWFARDAVHVLDEHQYIERAVALLEGRGFLGSYQRFVAEESRSCSVCPPLEDEHSGAIQPPGQTLLIAVALALGGGHLTAVKIWQVLLGTLGIGLVYRLAREWLDARHALVAGWICALHPDLIAFTHYLWSETLFTTLFLAALCSGVLASRSAGVGAAFTSGLCWGLAALTRTTALPLLAGAGLWQLVRDGIRDRRAQARFALTLTICALVILPWSVRNTRLHGGFVLLETNAPYNFWRGNGPDAFIDRSHPEGGVYLPPFHRIPASPVGNRTALRLVAEARRDLGIDHPSDLQIARYASSAAWAEIRRDPAAFLRRIPIRLFDLWNPTSFIVRHFQLGAYGAVPLHLVAGIGLCIAAYHLLLLGLAGIGLLWARRQAWSWLVLTQVGIVSAISALTFGLTRFRVPLLPLLAIPAALALLRIVAAWRRAAGPPPTAAPVANDNAAEPV